MIIWAWEEKEFCETYVIFFSKILLDNPVRVCGECAGCMRKNCGKCTACTRKPEFGGDGNYHKQCELKKCTGMGSKKAKKNVKSKGKTKTTKKKSSTGVSAPAPNSTTATKKLFKCSICDLGFYARSRVYTHVKNIHQIRKS